MEYRSSFVFFVALALLFQSGVALATPKVVINEIMYDPADDHKDYDGEWIELYNNESVLVDLGGWNISYDGHTEYTFPNNSVIHSGDFIVVSRNTTWFQITYGKGTLGDNLFGNLSSYRFSNSGTHWIALIAKNGTVVDNVTYTGGLCSENHSLERKDPLGSSDATSVREGSNWACSQINGGTPLKKNSVYVPFFGSYLLTVLVVLVLILGVRRA